jgi:hypothetical protein
MNTLFQDLSDLRTLYTSADSGITFSTPKGIDEPVYDAVFSLVPLFTGADKEDDADDTFAVLVFTALPLLLQRRHGRFAT